jgi:hypothetical protein
MHTWQWRTWNDLPYLTCSLLEPWAHGFFTQHYAPRLPETLTTVLDPKAQSYRVKQVHGNGVLGPSDFVALKRATEDGMIGEAGKVSEMEFPAADGLVTEQGDQAVWVCSADCTPVLIGDRVTGQVAAVHAGWRGTALKIVPQAIARLQAQGSKLKNLQIALGPAIAGSVYQVSEQVAKEVGASIFPMASRHGAISDRASSGTDHSEILEALGRVEDSPLLDDPEPGRVRLDVRRVNALQLEQLGIAPEQVAISPHCTFQDPDNFFSYRRSKQKKAQWSGIVSMRKAP